MNDTYEWLYSHYAKLQLEKSRKFADEATEKLAQTLDLSDNGKYELKELLEELRFNWGLEVFAIGLQLGLRLVLPTDFD